MSLRVLHLPSRAALTLLVSGSVAAAQRAGCPPVPAVVTDATVFLPCQVDSTVTVVSVGTPRSPSMLQSQGVSGDVTARFVVDAAGRVDIASVRFERSAHELFTQSVRNALPRWRFRPARRDGRPVRMAVDLLVAFRFPVGEWAPLQMDHRTVLDTLPDGMLRLRIGLPPEPVSLVPLDDAERRTIAVVMLRALVAAAVPPAAGARIVCLPIRPGTSRDGTTDPGLAFLTDPDTAFLQALQRPGYAVVHPRRCPPTHASMIRRTDEQGRPVGGATPAGEDPHAVWLHRMVVERDGRVYAEGGVSQGTGGQGWRCVARRDASAAQCGSAGVRWMH